MFNPEQIEHSLAEVMNAYQKRPREALQLRNQKIKDIHGPTYLKSGETFESTRYDERVMQEAEFPFTLAKRLKALDDPKYYPDVVRNTAKAVELGMHVMHLWKFDELEKQGSVLYVPRVELDPTIENTHPYVSISDVSANSEKYVERINKVTERIEELIEPAIGLSVSVSAFSVIVPYADQLVQIYNGDYEYGSGILLGVKGCVSNRGIESTRYLDKPLRTYTANAYREWNLCLELEPKRGKISEERIPVGIDINLAGLQRVYMPMTNFEEGNMHYSTSRNNSSR